MRRQANTDALTGLGNRSFFDRAAKRRLELYERNDLPLACAVLDVDDFKSYNDQFGHRGGDRVLRCLGRVLGECTRADDLVARYGGDEFVVLLGGDTEDAVKVAERVREGLETGCSAQGKPPRVVRRRSRWAWRRSVRRRVRCSSLSERRTRSSTVPRLRARTGWPPWEGDEEEYWED